MRPTALLLGALVLLPLAAEGQDITPQATPRSVTVRPVDVVAERVRSILFGDPNRASLIELAEVIPETSIGRSERVAANVVVSPTDEARDVAADVASADVSAMADPADAESTIVSAATDLGAIGQIVASDMGDLPAVDIPAAAVPATIELPEDGAPAGATATSEVLDVVAMGPAWTSEAPTLARPTLSEAGLALLDRLRTHARPTLSKAGLALVDRLRTVNVETLFRLLAAMLVLITMATLLRRRGDGRAPKSVRMTRRGPVVDARSLVAKGVPLHEVTRRTGLGRDALVLLAHRKPS